MSPTILFRHSFLHHLLKDFDSARPAAASLPKHVHRYCGQSDENVDLANDIEYFFGTLSANSIQYEMVDAEIANVA
jgi:hypothetical protein